MKNDRFLTGILIFIALLVIVAVTLFFVRGEQQAYLAEDTPEGVVHNYALALQDSDYERAYGYLADLENKPGYETFRQAFLRKEIDPSMSALQIGEVHLEDDGESAWVDVTILYAGSGLFDTGWSSSDRGTLIQQEGAWKISYLPYPYWGWDWYTDPIEIKSP